MDNIKHECALALNEMQGQSGLSEAGRGVAVVAAAVAVGEQGRCEVHAAERQAEDYRAGQRLEPQRRVRAAILAGGTGTPLSSTWARKNTHPTDNRMYVNNRAHTG